MTSERLTLADIAAPVRNAIVGGPFGSNLVSKDYVDSGVPVIRGQNMGGKWISGDFVFVTPAKATQLTQNKARPGDLVFTQRGTLGQVSLVPHGKYSEYVVSQSQMKITVDETKVDVSFLYYLFKTPAQLQYIFNSAIQTGVPHTNLGILKATPIELPPLCDQRSIAALVGAFDDRIALLRETNATLEAIAQALFKSWFIDFDPVRVKQQGLAPAGMDEATAALFPDSFEESALGVVPKGWHATALADAFEINPTRLLKKGTIGPYLEMASLATSGHCVDAPVHREFGSGMKFRNGDTLLARITPCLENGKSAFVDFLADDQVGWGSTEFIVLRPKAPLPEYLGYLLCRHPHFREHAIHSMSGTSGRQRVQNDVLGRYLLAVPDGAVARAFADIVTPMQRAIGANHSTAQTLAALRDTLLPRLISGRLRLPDAEALVP